MCSARGAATAGPSSTQRWTPSQTAAPVCWCTCGATRAGASASATRCRPTPSRTRAATPWTPTWSSACRWDDRTYGIGAAILADLGVKRVALMTNNPTKHDGLASFGLEIAHRVPLEVSPEPRTWTTSAPNNSASATSSIWCRPARCGGNEPLMADTYVTMYGVKRTTIYLPDDLSCGSEQAAEQDRCTEAAIVRDALNQALKRREVAPTVPLVC